MGKLMTGLWVLGIALLLGGCAATKGPDAIMSARGVTSTVVGTTGVAGSFIETASASFALRADSAKAEAMLNSGFALVYANCSDFFLSAGETQKWLIVSRDTVGAVGTLATGVMSLHNASQNAVANMAFLTGATFAGLDSYTKNFLFSAENVDSVRTLISRALAVHQAAVSEQGPFTYESAAMALMDHQNICTPMPIAALAKEAIKKGDVVSSAGDPNDPGGLARLQTDKVLDRLGVLNPPPSSLTLEQANALWWLLKRAPSVDEKRDHISPDLSGMTFNPVNSKGEYSTTWAEAANVRRALDELPLSVQKSFDAKILEIKAADQKARAAEKDATEKANSEAKAVRDADAAKNAAEAADRDTKITQSEKDKKRTDADNAASTAAQAKIDAQKALEVQKSSEVKKAGLKAFRLSAPAHISIGIR